MNSERGEMLHGVGESASRGAGEFFGGLVSVVLATAILLATCASVASAADEKGPLFDICAAGNLAGQCNTPRGIAINTTGNGGVDAGTVYVGDFNNNRIQSFTAEGSFIRAWGKNVSSLGGTGFEICTAAEEANCKIGEEGIGAGELKKISGGLAVDQATGNVYVIDRNNNRVQEFTAEGAFIRTWGKDVSSAGSTGFEICTAAEEANCKNGEPGVGAGEFTFGTLPLTGIGVDSGGNVYVTDSNIARVQKFDSAGNFLAMGGWDVTIDSTASDPANVTTYQVCIVAADCKAGAPGSGSGQFSAGGPSLLAVSPSGEVYAGDVTNAKIVHLSPSLALVDAVFAPAVVAEGAGSLRALTVENSADAHLYFSKTNYTNIVEVDPVTQGKVADHGAGAVNWVGLAVRSSNGWLYAASNGLLSSGKWIRVLAPLPAPEVALGSVTGVTGESATVSGTVDPKGGSVACKYQFSEDSLFPAQGRIEVPEPDCASLTPAGGSQAIGETISNLIPNTHYFVRIVVSRPSGAAFFSSVDDFNTDSLPPVVSNVGATEVQDISARLVGTINPRHSVTGYVFEYGTTPALGSTTPPVGIGDSATPVIVSSVVTGLSRDTTYYFRLSATNLAGTTISTSATLKTHSEGPPPPPERAYEQVTPDALNNVDAGVFEQAMMTVARDGQTVGVCNFYPPEGEGVGFCGGVYNSGRTATGWQSRSYLPPTCRIDPASGEEGGGILGGSQLFSENLDLAIFERPEWTACPYQPLTLNPAAQTDVTNLYRGDFVAEKYDVLAPNPAAAGTAVGGVGFGASDDFGVVFYHSDRQQTQDAPADESFAKLYEWDHGVLRLASVEPDGDPFGVDVEIAHSSTGGISEDGSRVFFHSPEVNSASPQLFMREAGTATYEIGQTECTVACGSTALFKRFTGASEDGSMVLFETPAKLSDEDNVNDENNAVDTTGRDLYLYRHSANPAGDRNLWVLTRDNEPADGIGSGFRGVIGKSDDGTVVYFAAAGQIVPGAPTADGFKIYRWRWNGGAPQVDFLATLDGASAGNGTCITAYKNDTQWVDENNWNCGRRFQEEPAQLEWVRRVRADGGQLTIDTIKALDSIADTDATRDVYIWDQAHGWRCVSCQLPGAPSAGVSQTTGAFGANAQNYPTQNDLPIAISSSDGKRIFFTSRDQLVPEDVNGSVRDVYEWNDGALSLISSGTSDKDNLLVGTSDSGNDVFFVTAQRLVGWDNDDARDIYDARVDGGFPEPPLPPPICEGEACKGAGTSAPENTGAGTAVFQGPDNSVQPPEPTRCPKGTRKVTVRGKQVCKKRRHHGKAKRQRRAASNDRRASR